VVAPSMNWMVPVAPRGATLARKITGMPWKAGFGNTLSVVVVALAPLRALTMKVTAGDVDDSNTAGSVGVNTAVNLCDPTGNDEVVVDAAPLVTVAGTPMLESPFLNCTLPAAIGETAALSVTEVPGSTGPAGDVVSVVVVSVGWGSLTTKVTAAEVEELKDRRVGGGEHRGQRAGPRRQRRGR
jgi:hypothetical protein